MTAAPPPIRRDRRRRASRLDPQLALLTGALPLVLAILPEQSALARTSWLLLSLSLAAGFGAIGERRVRRRLVMRGTLACCIAAFATVSALSIRESATDTPVFAALEAPTSPPASPPTTYRGLPEPATNSSVQAATATAEQELAACHDALRAVERAISPVTTSSTAPNRPDESSTDPEPESDRTVVERRVQCEDLVAFIAAAVRDTGAVGP